MNRYHSLRFISLLLLVFLAGVCVAAETPSYIAYVQGGENSITNGSNGTTVITVKDVVPYFHIADGKKSYLMSIERLIDLTYPLNAALVFSGTDNETFMVEISDLSISDGNKTLTLQAKALEFYEGSVLKTFADEMSGFDRVREGKYDMTSIYLEFVGLSPENYEGENSVRDNWSKDIAYRRRCIEDGICPPSYLGDAGLEG